MARKPRNYAAEYERRIRIAEARGETRQEARGHRERRRGLPAEHKRRAETAKARGELTQTEKAFIRRRHLISPYRPLSDQMAEFGRLPPAVRDQVRAATTRIMRAEARGGRRAARAAYFAVHEEMDDEIEDYEIPDYLFWY